MATNKNALRRYMIIDRCIRNTMSPYPSRFTLHEKIMEELMLDSFSVPQVDKDIKELKEEHNAPLQYDRLRKGYYYTDSNYSFKHSITDEDLWILDFAAAAVQVYGHTDINQKFLNLSDRLNTGKNTSRTEEVVPYNFIQIELSTTKNGYEWLFDLYLYINKNQTVKIEYTPFGRGATKHTISPYLLKQHNNRWYIIGYSHEKNRTLIFALDRIKKMTKSNDAYTIDPEFDTATYFNHSFGVHHSYLDPPEKVKLLFSERLKPYILSLPIHKTQEVLVDNSNGLLIEIEVYCKGNYDFLAKVLSYGDEVEVLSPDYLKEEIMNKANAMMEKYV